MLTNVPALWRRRRQITLGSPLFAPLCLVNVDAVAVVGAQDGFVYGKRDRRRLGRSPTGAGCAERPTRRIEPNPTVL
jgi:hypothetical protein